MLAHGDVFWTQPTRRSAKGKPLANILKRKGQDDKTKSNSQQAFPLGLRHWRRLRCEWGAKQKLFQQKRQLLFDNANFKSLGQVQNNGTYTTPSLHQILEYLKAELSETFKYAANAKQALVKVQQKV
jgi:hypothetical protein